MANYLDFGVTDIVTSPVYPVTDGVIGDYEMKTVPVVVKSGQELDRLTAIAKQTSDGKYYQYDSTANDGTETLKGILVDDVDSTDDDVKTSMYVSGVFEYGKVAASPVDLPAGVYNYGAIVIMEVAE
jgi:hypothetical protein